MSFAIFNKLYGLAYSIVPRPGDVDAAAVEARPLLAAAKHGDVPAELLVDLEAATPEGCTALTIAAENGRAEAVRVLAAAGADVNRRSRKTPTTVTGTTHFPALLLA